MLLEEKGYENHKNQVVLIIPSTGDANRLYELIKNVTEVLSARLVKITGSREENIMTLELDKAIPTDQVIEQLSSIPEVVAAEQKQPNTAQGATDMQTFVIVKEIAMGNQSDAD